MTEKSDRDLLIEIYTKVNLFSETLKELTETINNHVQNDKEDFSKLRDGMSKMYFSGILVVLGFIVAIFAAFVRG